MTKIELDLTSDIDLYLVFKKEKRRSISYILNDTVKQTINI